MSNNSHTHKLYELKTPSKDSIQELKSKLLRRNWICHKTSNLNKNVNKNNQHILSNETSSTEAWNSFNSVRWIRSYEHDLMWMCASRVLRVYLSECSRLFSYNRHKTPFLHMNMWALYPSTHWYDYITQTWANFLLLLLLFVETSDDTDRNTFLFSCVNTNVTSTSGAILIESSQNAVAQTKCFVFFCLCVWRSDIYPIATG